MELLILNNNFNIIDIIDTYESLIWTERYNSYGDFEMYAMLSDKILAICNADNYVKISDSNRLMVIEDYEIKSDFESGAQIIIKGRSIESILDRRIIWDQTLLEGNLQNGIKKLLDENAIIPVLSDREIPNLTFEESTDPIITALTVNTQYTREELYESIAKLCVANDIGFRLVLSDDESNLVFQLYAGSDRTYDQLLNPYVVFSQQFENLINSNYSENTQKMKTITVVAGEGEEEIDRMITVVGEGVGLARREMYTDASGLSQTVDGDILSDPDYMAQLEQKGIEDLAENSLERAFDSQVDATQVFVYGRDFFLGDLVQVASEYGIESKARVTEFIRSQSTSGMETYPKFKII